MNKKLYIFFFLLALFSLLLKLNLKTKEISENDYYSNKRTKKETIKEIEKFNYEDYQKRKNIELKNDYNIFELNKPKKKIEVEKKEITVTTTEEIPNEKELIKKEIENIEFSGTIKMGNLEKNFLTYKNNLLELNDGSVIQIFVNEKNFDIYVSFDNENSFLLFYEPTYNLSIKSEVQ